MLKRILAVIGLIVIAAWIIATLVIAIIPFPGKELLFPIFIIGCILFPIILWVALWIIGSVTGKKNIASFKTEEMDETERLAEEIKASEKENR